jgi:hypothetical protein
MGAFRRVEGEQAGPAAVGILIPPGRRTFVILRPRPVPFDLLLCRGPDDLAFRDLSHDEASAAAQMLFRALREWAAGGPGGVEPAPGPDGAGLRLRVRVGSFALVVCRRAPGQPYASLVCTDAEARHLGAALAGLLCPGGAAEQEVYFNTRFFERPEA